MPGQAAPAAVPDSTASISKQLPTPGTANTKHPSSSSSTGGACVKLAAGSKSVTAAAGASNNTNSAVLSAAAAAASAAFVAAKLGLNDQLEGPLSKNPGLASLRDAEGRCCLHYAAGYGHEVRERVFWCLCGVCRVASLSCEGIARPVSLHLVRPVQQPAARSCGRLCVLHFPCPSLCLCVTNNRNVSICCWTRAGQMLCVRGTTGATWPCTWQLSRATQCAHTTWQRCVK